MEKSVTQSNVDVVSYIRTPVEFSRQSAERYLLQIKVEQEMLGKNEYSARLCKQTTECGSSSRSNKKAHVQAMSVHDRQARGPVTYLVFLEPRLFHRLFIFLLFVLMIEHKLLLLIYTETFR